MNSDTLRQHIQQTTALAQAICRALQEQAMGLGYSAADVVIGDPDQAVYRLSRDPASGEDSLLGEWRDDGGQKLGELIFHADGSFYAEYDVIRTLPHDDRLFVEAVNAWGRDGQIRAEPRLLPMVS